VKICSGGIGVTINGPSDIDDDADTVSLAGGAAGGKVVGVGCSGLVLEVGGSAGGRSVGEGGSAVLDVNCSGGEGAAAGGVSVGDTRAELVGADGVGEVGVGAELGSRMVDGRGETGVAGGTGAMVVYCVTITTDGGTRGLAVGSWPAGEEDELGASTGVVGSPVAGD
jgi:hypothetical protein